METRTRILDVAQDLIQKMGANAMSYQDISLAVGIRKASIHHHFPTKDALIQALMARYREYFFGLMDQIAASKATGLKKLKAYAALFEATLEDSACEKACPMAMLGAEVQTLGVNAAASVKGFFAENDSRLAAILEEGRKDGSLVFAGSALAMAGAVTAMFEGAMLIARGRGSADHFRHVADQLFRMLRP